MTIPTGVASVTLNFYLWASVVTTPFTDTLEIQVDGVTQQTITEPAIAEGGYSLRSVDLTAFADGASHTIQFLYTQPANGAQGMDFDPSTDTLYAWLFFSDLTSHLATFDLATGAATILADGNGEQLEGAVAVASLEPTPVALSVDPTGNTVLELNETVTLVPSWMNPGAADFSLTGTVSNFAGGVGLTLLIPDSTANYGIVAAGASADCGADCYTIEADGVRVPGEHLDLTIDESVVSSPATGKNAPDGANLKTWTLHVGGSFADVSTDIVADPYYPSIETIFHKGVTGGCHTGSDFCPTDPTTRAQMAVFLLKASQGSSYVPPSCTGVFSDVPCPSTPEFPFSDWIEDLHSRGITAGCSSDPGPPPTIQYCPDQNVTRAQMAVFLLKTSQGSAYVPPACTSLFSDVPCPSTPEFPFSDWIEDLYNRGITAGCSSDPGPPPTIQYCPDANVLRQEMAVFLTKTFSLVLYGP